MKLFRKKSTMGSDVVMLTISNFMVSIIGVITSMLLARFRTLHEYGTYAQIIMITDLVSTILLLGLPGSVNYFIAKADTEEEKQKFLTLYLLLSTILTFVIGVSLFFAVPLIIQYFDNPYIKTFSYIFAIYPWASIIINSLSNVCVVSGNANRLVVFNAAHIIVNLALILLAKALGWDFQTYTLIYILSMLLFAFFAVWWMRRIVGGFRFSIDWKLVKTIFAFSIPMGLASSIGTLNSELDKLIIGWFFTTEEYAIFANAAKTLPVTILATSLTAVLLPKLVRLLKAEKNEEAVSLWASSINLSFCFMCLVVGGLVVFAPDVMALFYSEKYVTRDGVAVFRIYSLILLFRATYWGIVLNAKGKTQFIFYSSILTLVLNCIGNIGCFYLFGFIGPAISSLVVIAVMGLAQLVVTSKLLKVPFRTIFPWRKLGIFLLQTVILGIGFYFIKYYWLVASRRLTSIIISIGLGVLWAILYAALNIKNIKKDWKALSTDTVEEKTINEETQV